MAERKPKRAAAAAGFDLPAEQSRVMKSKWESRDKAAGPAAPVGVKALGLARPLAPKEKRLVGAGDSWFQYGLFRDVLDCLQDDFGYDIRKEAAPGATCNTLVYEWLTNALPLIKSHQPKAFLFSGGGNDIAGPEFILMLNHQRSGLPALNRGVAEAVVASLRHAYETMIKLTNHYCATEYREIVPIVVHGYADPVPDGRGVIWFGPWLGPSFDNDGLGRHGGAQGRDARGHGPVQRHAGRAFAGLQQRPPPGPDETCSPRPPPTGPTNSTPRPRASRRWPRRSMR